MQLIEFTDMKKIEYINLSFCIKSIKYAGTPAITCTRNNENEDCELLKVENVKIIQMRKLKLITVQRNMKN